MPENQSIWNQMNLFEEINGDEIASFPIKYDSHLLCNSCRASGFTHDSLFNSHNNQSKHSFIDNQSKTQGS